MMETIARNHGIKQTLSGWTARAMKIGKAIERAGAADSSDNSMVIAGFFGGQAALQDFHFPAELVGGSCPRIRGQEREIAWHAAAEACDSERIHIVWHAEEDKVWYLAARSADFSSRALTWCPFASLMPGMKDAIPSPVCYTYYSDEAAIMMTVTDDTLQVHRGTSSVVRAKAERVSRELGNARIVELDPDIIISLAPVAWYSLSLHEDRMRRLLTLALLFAGSVCTMIAFLIWLGASLAILSQNRDLEEVQARTQSKTIALMRSVEKLRASALRDQITRFSDLNDGLMQVGAWMKFYLIRGNEVRWRAQAPHSVTGDKIKELGAKLLQTTDQGVIIGTDLNNVDKR